jgi:hypothetical protein
MIIVRMVTFFWKGESSQPVASEIASATARVLWFCTVKPYL